MDEANCVTGDQVFYVKKLITAFLTDLLSSAAASAVLGSAAWICFRVCGYSVGYGVALRWALILVVVLVLSYDLVTKAVLAPWSVHGCSRRWGVSWSTAADAICLGILKEKSGHDLTSEDVEVFVGLRRRRAN